MRTPEVALVCLAAALLGAGCARDTDREARALTGGEPSRGKQAIRKYGCGSCHQIPGVPGAVGKVGPPLEAIASRTYLGGRLSNNPENMKEWVKHPQKAEQGTAMPDLGVSDEDARDMAAFLYTLK